jgi:hypothetical protein
MPVAYKPVLHEEGLLSDSSDSKVMLLKSHCKMLDLCGRGEAGDTVLSRAERDAACRSTSPPFVETEVIGSPCSRRANHLRL